jgi:HD superfamily phosphohydrolase
LQRLIFGKHYEQADEVDAIISSIIDSGVDADKLSYLTLDAHCSGVPFGKGIDLSGILRESTLSLVDYGSRGELPHLAFDENAIGALESAVMTRYWNFRALYWEHRNRAVMAMLLRTVRNLFSDKKLNFYDYLGDTLWSGDLSALTYLDDVHQRAYGKPSILHGLVADEKTRYVRLYALRTARPDAPDSHLYDRLKELTLAQELRVAQTIARQIEDENRATVGSVGTDEILIDIPRRRLDAGGEVYIAGDDGKAKLLSDLSDPVRAISRHYQHLTKSIRVFASPRIANALTPEPYDKWRRTIETAVKEVAQSGQVI